jgi:hypothetical protein
MYTEYKYVAPSLPRNSLRKNSKDFQCYMQEGTMAKLRVLKSIPLGNMKCTLQAIYSGLKVPLCID